MQFNPKHHILIIPGFDEDNAAVETIDREGVETGKTWEGRLF